MTESESPFPMPKMQCRECGKEPHDGYCYPVLDGLLVVLVPVAGIGLLIALLIWMWV